MIYKRLKLVGVGRLYRSDNASIQRKLEETTSLIRIVHGSHVIAKTLITQYYRKVESARQQYWLRLGASDLTRHEKLVPRCGLRKEIPTMRPQLGHNDPTFRKYPDLTFYVRVKGGSIVKSSIVIHSTSHWVFRYIIGSIGCMSYTS